MSANHMYGVKRGFLSDLAAKVKLAFSLFGGSRDQQQIQIAKDEPFPLSIEEKIALARSINVSENELDLLARDVQCEVRCHAAQNPKCPTMTLAAIAKDKSRDVRLSVAVNPNVHVTLLTEMLISESDLQVQNTIYKAIQAQDPYRFIRSDLAGKTNIPGSILALLSEDHDHGVREWAAAHPNCPGDILSLLGADHINGVRESAAAHPNCPSDTMLTLSTDHYWGVRVAVAANPICSASILSSMSNDHNEDVRAMAAGNPNCPTLSLIRLANDVDSETRSNAQNTLCSKTKDFWVKAVDDGLSLSSVLENCFMYANNRFVNTAVGDALLAAGLSNVYQLIQSAELTIQVKQSADITKNPDPLPLIGAPRVRNLRM